MQLTNEQETRYGFYSWDGWHSKALGFVAARIYELLEKRPLTSSMLAAAMGTKPCNLSRPLAKLKRAGLISVDAVWAWKVPGVEPYPTKAGNRKVRLYSTTLIDLSDPVQAKAVAVKLGIPNYSKIRQQRHAVDRERQNEWLLQRQAIRGEPPLKLLYDEPEGKIYGRVSLFEIRADADADEEATGKKTAHGGGFQPAMGSSHRAAERSDIGSLLVDSAAALGRPSRADAYAAATG
ncbi:MAG: helix-turn-helix domain-containing protein [Candidatus Binataceae bacterium]|jgi:DNA-binding transcriptional ArsR family regulator